MSSIREVHTQSAQWRDFCAQRPEMTLFQSPEWSGVVERTYGFYTGALALVEPAGNIVAGLPFAQIEDFRGTRRVSLAFADNLESLPLESWPTFERAIEQSRVPWKIRTRSVPSAPSEIVATHHIIGLPSTFEAAWQGFHPSHRQHTRKAEKAGLRARVLDVQEGLSVFYELHSNVRKSKFGLMPQPMTFFENIADAFFPDRGFVLAAELDGKVLATLFMLVCNRTLYYKFGASALDTLEVRPNNFLFSNAIELAIERGYESLDLGISDTEGLIRFKERLGGRPSPVYACAYNTPAKPAGVAEIERALGAITNVLTDPSYPLSAAQRGGEILYRFFT